MTPEEIERKAKEYMDGRKDLMQTPYNNLHVARLMAEFALHYHNQEMKEKIEGLILKWEKEKKLVSGDDRDIDRWHNIGKNGAINCNIDDLKALLK